jgi:hypothetical protein
MLIGILGRLGQGSDGVFRGRPHLAQRVARERAERSILVLEQFDEDWNSRRIMADLPNRFGGANAGRWIFIFLQDARRRGEGLLGLGAELDPNARTRDSLQWYA